MFEELIRVDGANLLGIGYPIAFPTVATLPDRRNRPEMQLQKS
jgi:hypothetical protein